ncbi:MAG TPA: hemolysin family protein [Turneriella sp.]|nr:hemolysin family protein [Turneriella sp.]
MNHVLLELIFIPILIFLNGIFSLAEMAVVSSRRSRLQVLADAGSRGARQVLKMLDDPERFFSTIQIAITLISILTGVISGAAATDVLAAYLKERFPSYAQHAVSVAFFSIVFFATYLAIVFGELIPKSIAVRHSETIAVLVAYPLRLVIDFFSPFSYVLSATAKIILRPFGIRGNNKAQVTEEEIRIMLQEGHETGAVLSSEKSMVENVFRLDDIAVVTVMTPKPLMTWLDVANPIQDILETIREHNHSYYPVVDGSLEKVIGVLPARPLLADLNLQQARNLKDYLVSPLYVPESMKASRLLETFKQTQRHFALITDEFGGIQGVATLHDILEAIVGDLPPQSGDTEKKFRRRDDGSVAITGTVTLAEFRDELGFSLVEGLEDDQPYSTVAGFLAAHMQRIPTEGERIAIPEGGFEIVDMDGPRIDKILFFPSKSAQ